MKGVDTNILARFFIGDVAEQSEKITEVLGKGEQFYINASVLTELTWVLISSYKFTKDELVQAYDNLLDSSAFIVFDHAIVVKALSKFIGSSADFNDCLICEINNAHSLSTLTFDKKAAQLEGMELLG
ncbi:MAG: type II toxin-antitoxin system VapC family toxin [bacterium]|nr:type II toxin-antitoxin system VapC family toxin [bacterium]